MIKKVLIANRAEIAVRVIKTCKKMGIKTVSVYAQDDAFLPHVDLADESVCLGYGELAQTYLNIDKIIEIAKTRDVDGIHPGYGFLSENKEFCSKVKAAGILFIGPDEYAIEVMGDKIASKRKMQELNIPLIPGYHGEDQSLNGLKTEAEKILRCRLLGHRAKKSRHGLVVRNGSFA